MRKILRVLAVLALAAGAIRAEQDPPDPAAPLQSDPEVVRAVQEALDGGREAAAARVREARDAVAAERKEAGERDARIERALKDMTAKTPLRVVFSENTVLNDVRVTGYYNGRVTLTWPQGQVEYPLELLPEETRSALLGGALSKGTARDYFEIGKMLVRGKDWERAARCFATAGQRDPAFVPFAPDLEKVKRAARLFEGAFKTSGNTLSLRWGFSSPGEGADFAPLQGSASVRPGQGLDLDGAKIALTAVKEIPFRDRVKASALAKETDAAAHLLGIRFVKPDGGEVIIYGALGTSIKSFLVMRVEDGKAQEVLAQTPGASGNRMTMEFNRGRFSFQVGERTVWSGSEGGFTDVLVLLGATPLQKPGGPSRASATFKEVTLSGEVNPRWMAKKTAALRDAMSSELSKEFRAKRAEGAAGGLDLSVEPAVARAAEDVRTAYRAALAKISTMQKSQLQDDLVAAADAMEQVTTAHAAFAPAWYYRGVLSETAGDRRAAAEHYDKALALLPVFPEAHCRRGRLHALSGRWEEARKNSDQALALKADLPDVQLLRARLLWEARDVPGVLEAAQIARRLAPLDPGIQSEAQMLSNVARGPQWPKPNAHATAHYQLRSDLSPAKCKAYAEHLEGVRTVYEEILGRALPAGKPAEVLIFDSEEGYYSYNDFTAGDRQENSLGAFSSWHGQMALFEGVDPAETLRVLSHEGFHQALHAVAPDVPIWFNEGMAEYAGGSRVEKGKVVERGEILTGRLDNLKFALKYGWSPVPFEKIFVETKSEFYGELAPFKYAQAWSMIRYFIHGEGGRWKGLLKEYTDRLLAGDSARAAYDATFAKQDLPQLESGWRKYYGFVVTPRKAVKKADPEEPPAESAPVDLLAGLSQKGALPEPWRMDGKVLECQPKPGVLLDLGYEPPAEYDWRFTVQRFFGETALWVGLQSGGRKFILKLDENRQYGLEAFDDRPGLNETYQRNGMRLMPGLMPVVVSVRRTGVRVTVNGQVMLDWRGSLERLTLPTTLPGSAPEKNLFLYSPNNHFRISAMTVKAFAGDGSQGPGGAKPLLPKIAVDPARSIAVEAEISRWVVDQDNDQILALDGPGKKLLQISLSERKVLRKTATGAGEPSAICLALAPGNAKMAWIGNQGEAQNLIRIDLAKGTIVETIPVAYQPASLLIFRKYLWCLDKFGMLHGLDLSDKKALEPNLNIAYTGMVYDARRDRLWTVGHGAVTDFDGSKIGVILKELSRTNLSVKDQMDLRQALGAAGKTYPTPNGIPQSFGAVLDEKGGRIYFSRSASKVDKMPGLLGTFAAPPHTQLANAAVQEYAWRCKILDDILAVSPDGKWVASGTHLFNATTFAVVRELPLPTSLVAFSKDSKEICTYDWVNRVAAFMDVESK